MCSEQAQAGKPYLSLANCKVWSAEAGVMSSGLFTFLRIRQYVCIRMSYSKQKMCALTERRRGARELPSFASFATLRACRARLHFFFLFYSEEHFEMYSATGCVHPEHLIKHQNNGNGFMLTLSINATKANIFKRCCKQTTRHQRKQRPTPRVSQLVTSTLRVIYIIIAS